MSASHVPETASRIISSAGKMVKLQGKLAIYYEMGEEIKTIQAEFHPRPV